MLVDEFNDVGTNILAASDSMLGGCDTYSWVISRVSFTDNESTEDNFVLSKSIASSFSGVATDYSDSTVTMTGSTPGRSPS